MNKILAWVVALTVMTMIERGLTPQVENTIVEIPSTIFAAQNFIHFVTEGELPTIKQLSIALDTLAQAYNEAADGAFSESDAEPPPRDYQSVRNQLRLRFPYLGYYELAWPDRGVVTSDAIGDLADILGDLREVMWRFEYLGANDALWHFKFLFKTHWGLHLRDLSLHLHFKQFYMSDPFDD